MNRLRFFPFRLRRMDAELLALLLVGVFSASALRAQDVPRPGERSSPFDRAPQAGSSTPTPIPQTSEDAAPSVVLPDSHQLSAADPPSSSAQDLSLEIQTEPDGSYVTITELLRVIRQVDARAQGRWDGLLGVFRIEASGHSLQALSKQPLLIVDGKTNAVNRPLRVRGGVALVPAGTVNQIFRALEFDFALPESMAGPAPSAGDSTRRSSVGSVGGLEGPRSPRPSMLSAGDPLFPSVDESAMAQLDIPQVDASVAGLTWAKLTDYAHPRAPRRLTIVYDPPFHKLADALGRVSQRAGPLEVALISVEKRRDDPSLITRIAQSQPEILIDLVSSSGADNRKFEVWSVHEALWMPPSKPQENRARMMRELYVAHQFHNLALGSVIRAELARSFPDGTVRHDLSPSYLLRRVDAPSAAIVIPEELAEGNDGDLERVARALAGGFAGYYRGIQSATRL